MVQDLIHVNFNGLFYFFASSLAKALYENIYLSEFCNTPQRSNHLMMHLLKELYEYEILKNILSFKRFSISTVNGLVSNG